MFFNTGGFDRFCSENAERYLNADVSFENILSNHLYNAEFKLLSIVKTF